MDSVLLLKRCNELTEENFTLKKENQQLKDRNQALYEFHSKVTELHYNGEHHAFELAEKLEKIVETSWLP